mgnify:FL=1
MKHVWVIPISPASPFVLLNQNCWLIRTAECSQIDSSSFLCYQITTKTRSTLSFHLVLCSCCVALNRSLINLYSPTPIFNYLKFKSGYCWTLGILTKGVGASALKGTFLLNVFKNRFLAYMKARRWIDKKTLRLFKNKPYLYWNLFQQGYSNPGINIFREKTLITLGGSGATAPDYQKNNLFALENKAG